MVKSSNEKLSIGFTILRNIAVATCIMKNNKKPMFFIKDIFKIKQCFEFMKFLKNNIDLIKKITMKKLYQCGPYLEFFLSINGLTQINSFLDAIKIIFFLIKNVSKNFVF